MDSLSLPPQASSSLPPTASVSCEEKSEVEAGRDGGRKPIVVILIGAPGSGKSTFCEDVMRAARRPWVRVCQDNVANGKAGIKVHCKQAASDALKEGKSVFIDRCNLERQQRSEFVKIGGIQFDIHAVVLDLPAKLCISRAIKCSRHEGNLQGGNAAFVVNGMLKKKELPKLNEGFSRITFCQNEADVKDVVTRYCNLGPFDNLPSGCFGQKSAVQVSIMQFLKKVDPPSPSFITSHGNPADNVGSNVQPLVKDQDDQHPINVARKVVESENFEFESRKSSWRDVPILAFPSISTSDFQFDHERASDIIVERVSDFLDKNESMRLVLVDLNQTSKILLLVKAKAASLSIDPNRFCTFVGDITRLSSGGNLCCQVIANAANWRLKPGGGGVNAAVFSAAGETLVTATKERAGTLSPGNSVAVPLSPTSPLHKKEGVTHVIHVLGPNMNPQRPDCLNGDYEKGCQILHKAYSSLFENFASIVRSQGSMCRDTSLVCNSYYNRKPKRDGSECTGNNKRLRGNYAKTGTDSESYPFQSGVIASTNHGERSMCVDNEDSQMDNCELKKSWGVWGQTLYEMAMNPKKHKRTLLEISDNYVVLDDLYPKAKRHVLVLSRVNGLAAISDARIQHLPMLQEMHAAGIRWAEKFLNEDGTLVFRLGYHSVPSMRQLHLHVVSQDFDGLYRKNKKNWNSFASAFFRDSVDVMEEIKTSGRAIIKDRSLLSMQPQCHRCRRTLPNISEMKSHIKQCRAPFPEHLLQNGRLVGPREK